MNSDFETLKGRGMYFGLFSRMRSEGFLLISGGLGLEVGSPEVALQLATISQRVTAVKNQDLPIGSKHYGRRWCVVSLPRLLCFLDFWSTAWHSVHCIARQARCMGCRERSWCRSVICFASIVLNLKDARCKPISASGRKCSFKNSKVLGKFCKVTKGFNMIQELDWVSGSKPQFVVKGCFDPKRPNPARSILQPVCWWFLKTLDDTNEPWNPVASGDLAPMEATFSNCKVEWIVRGVI